MTLIAIIVGLFGLMAGSFVNALVWRLHEQGAGEEEPVKSAYSGETLSITRGRSICPHCGHQLGAKDLVPLFSWLWLRGKCRYCRGPISRQYPVVELLTALLFAGSAVILAPQSNIAWVGFIGWLVILTGLMALTVYDLRWMLLPDRIIYPLIFIMLAVLLFEMALGMPQSIAARHVLAALVLGGAFFTLASLAGGRLFGGGDVKLGFLMGLILGLRGVTVATLLAFWSAAIVGVVLMIVRHKTRKSYLPFGPFLVLGTIIALWHGKDIIDWYLRLNGLQ
jgi:leader peptidase (prepilin peptidase)/N-methyltransferase